MDEGPSYADTQALRAEGERVLALLGHGTRPPRARPLRLGQVPGLDRYTTEALWGSVWTRPGLDVPTRLLLTLAVLTSLQRLPQLRTYLHSARNIDVPTEAIEEVLVQCSAQAGVPVTVNALELLRDVLEQRGEAPDGGPERGGIAAANAGAGDEETGRLLAERLFGTAVPVDDDFLASLEQRFVLGRIFPRRGLDLTTRVLCALAAACGLRDPDEVRRWVQAARRLDVAVEILVEVVIHTAFYAGFPSARAALKIVGEPPAEG